MNVGSSIGSIYGLKLEFIAKNDPKKRTVMYPMRRVHVEAGPEGTARMGQQNMIDDLPLLPIYVPPSNGVSFLFEFHDIHDEFKTELDTEYSAKVHVTYDGDKKATGEFIYKIEADFFNKSRVIRLNSFFIT